MKKTKFLSLVLSGVMLLPSAVMAEENAEFEQFERISNYAANLYIDDTVTVSDIMTDALKSVMKDNPELMMELIKAGFASLDEYTEFYTQEEYELFKNNMNHILYGIGVIIQEVEDYVTVMSCVEGGGAEAAGVQSGDKISKVDGVDVKGAGIDKVQDLIVGELGTEVCVTFLREDKEFEAVITRQEVSGSTVGSTILTGNIGYISVVNFSAKTHEEIKDVLDEFDAEGVEKIIIDLRDNPGGYFDSAIETAKLLVPEGVIVSTVYRNEYQNETFYSELKETKYDLAVLVNENTASSAEILASAIKDSEAGILIGNITYGKGVIQHMYDLWDGYAFKITTGRYFTRNGMDINGNGIVPDELVDNTTEPIDITQYSTFDYKTKPMVGEASPNVFAAKERLKILGYYGGKVDDIFDERFERAVYNFQESNGLFPYGVLDVSTQASIENVFYKSEKLIDDQLIFAYEYFGGNEEDLYKDIEE